MPTSRQINNRYLKGDAAVTIGIVAVMAYFVGSGIVVYSNIENLRVNTEQVMRTHDSILSLSNLSSLLKDAETGQRGYIITGEERYLEPYDYAVRELDKQLQLVEKLLSHNAEQAERLALAKQYMSAKLSELAYSVDLRRKQGLNAARAVVLQDIGKNSMDAFRTYISLMQGYEREMRQQRLQERDDSLRTTITNSVTSALLGLFLAGLVGWIMRRVNAMRRREAWLQTAQTGISTVMLGEQTLEKLSSHMLKFLC